MKRYLHHLLVASQLSVRVTQVPLTSAGVTETAYAQHYAAIVGRALHLKNTMLTRRS